MIWEITASIITIITVMIIIIIVHFHSSTYHK
jgi:hypothetical protein